MRETPRATQLFYLKVPANYRQYKFLVARRQSNQYSFQLVGQQVIFLVPSSYFNQIIEKFYEGFMSLKLYHFNAFHLYYNVEHSNYCVIILTFKIIL
jgi:hypothetical protein